MTDQEWTEVRGPDGRLYGRFDLATGRVQFVQRDRELTLDVISSVREQRTKVDEWRLRPASKTKAALS